MTAVKSRTAKPAAQPADPIDLGPMQDYVGHLQSILQESAWPKSDRTRFRLKIATVSVLAEVGYQDLKVSDICERAEVALGTFYNYFTEKSVIAAEVLLDFGDELYMQAQSIAHGTGRFQAILRTNQFFAAAYQRNCGLVRCLIQLEDQVPDFRTRWRERRLQWLQKIARSMARRSGHPEIPEILFMQVAYALEGLVFTYLYDVFVRQEPILQGHAGSPDHIAELLSVLWYRALYLQDPPAEELQHVQATLVLHQDPVDARVVSAGAKAR